MIKPFNRLGDRHLFGGRDVMKNILPVLDFLYFVLGWFTISVEVFLRRDFGERHLTRLNFSIGFILLGAWLLIVGGIISMARAYNRNAYMDDWSGGFSSMGWMWFGFILLSSIHFIQMWWRSRTDQPLHSLDAGKSWLLPLGKLLIGLVNIAAFVPIKLFALTLSVEDKKQLEKLLPLVPDSRALTERILEPIAVLIVGAFFLSNGAIALGMWLTLVSIALTIHTNYRYETERYQFLHIRDQIIEAKHLPKAINGTSDIIRIPKSTRETLTQTVEHIKTDAPEMMEEIKQSHPSLADAMAALNSNTKN